MRYSAFDRELLAIFSAVKHFLYFLDPPPSNVNLCNLCTQYPVFPPNLKTPPLHRAHSSLQADPFHLIPQTHTARLSQDPRQIPTTPTVRRTLLLHHPGQPSSLTLMFPTTPKTPISLQTHSPLHCNHSHLTVYLHSSMLSQTPLASTVTTPTARCRHLLHHPGRPLRKCHLTALSPVPVGW